MRLMECGFKQCLLALMGLDSVDGMWFQTVLVGPDGTPCGGRKDIIQVLTKSLWKMTGPIAEVCPIENGEVGLGGEGGGVANGVAPTL